MRDLKIISTLSARTYTSLPKSIQKTCSIILYDLFPVLKSTLDLSTLLTIGMCLQTLAFYLLPRYLAAAPAALFLFYKLLYLRPSIIADNWYIGDARLGKWSGSIPNEDGSLPDQAATNGVVCFVVGSQLNHPLGAFAPGVSETAGFFDRMWHQAEKDPEKWGLLSRTPQLASTDNEAGGTYLVHLSYWKSLDHLRTFAATSIHAEGRKWWESTRKQWPHLGIFHETFSVPPGHYETIYENCHPFGMGQISGLSKSGDKLNVLRRANTKEWRSMDSRMGREGP